MKKIITLTIMTAAALALTTPADADSVSGGAKAADPWNFISSAVCLQELAVVPVGGPPIADLSCEVGNVIGQGL
ncbi:hypothetical protein ACSNOH_01065 [Streptomyces sp. URMC 127]|uniref:hypothetical protein n=1 Tax=Streptomyces sp. URMC 127 TaxID=3423402 RepID=UPI003F1D332E